MSLSNIKVILQELNSFEYINFGYLVVSKNACVFSGSDIVLLTLQS